MSDCRPRYLELLRSGELQRRVRDLMPLLDACTVCPRQCGVNRSRGERGFCRVGALPVLSASVAHFGEEPPISGTRGSGCVFLGSCNLRCAFCQNWQISQQDIARQPIAPHLGPGVLDSGSAAVSSGTDGTRVPAAGEVKRVVGEIDAETLACAMLGLQARGCHNINFVSPTHFAPQIVHAICLAAQKGLHVPIVYNTNGYDSIEVLRLLRDVVDIYMPDMKYGSNAPGQTYSAVSDYWDCARAALSEMYRQVGNLQVDGDGIAVRGLIVRHLILPNDQSETEAALAWLASELSPDVTISLMSQYYPTYRADEYPLIGRRLTTSEYARATELLDALGLENGWAQEPEESPDSYRPDFEQTTPFER